MAMNPKERGAIFEKLRSKLSMTTPADPYGHPAKPFKTPGLVAPPKPPVPASLAAPPQHPVQKLTPPDNRAFGATGLNPDPQSPEQYVGNGRQERFKRLKRVLG